ncbi:MAG: hypothetical protein HOP29_16390 [Phycisphaerales bacterium]|nr:hypothetical protein [Phycisphaerales bacterium]
MAMTDEALERIDPLVINLAVARGVPELFDLDVARYVNTLDAWAAEIRFDTERHRYRFAADPEQFHHSEVEYRITWLASDINAVFKVDYDIADFDAADPGNLFLNGVIDRKLGTCVSMPMLYVALGWRLDYAIKPVAVPTHLFARWDDGANRVNIEATGYGADNPDSLYEGEYFVSDAMKTRGRLLQSLAPRRTLAVLLLARADYWSRHGDHDRRLADVLRANLLYPEYPLAIIELERAWLARGKHDPYYADVLEDFDRAVTRINERFLASRGHPVEKLIFDENGPRRVLVNPITGNETPIE